MKKVSTLILILLWSFAFLSYGENYPQRIISLGPAITEKLYLLGLGERIVANTLYCKRPPEAEKIGTVIEVNVEKILSLKPDLVIATSLTDLRAIEKIKSLGIKIISFSEPKNFDQLCEQFLELGKITGRESVAKEIVEKAKERVGSIKKKINNLSKPKVFIQIGAKPLFTVTGNSFINDFIEFAGGVNIAQGSKSGLYSREEVVKNNPDIIIIVTMGIVGEEDIWKRYKSINAVKNKKIYIIDAYKLCSPTPLSFVDTLEELVKIFHPEIR